MKLVRARYGVTLLELVVVLAILGVLLSGTGLLRFNVPQERGAWSIASGHDSLRKAAIQSGRPATTVLQLEGAARSITVWPSGRTSGWTLPKAGAGSHD